MSKASGACDGVGSASTATTEVSQSARQKSLASVQKQLGASAKSQPPVGGVIEIRGPNNRHVRPGQQQRLVWRPVGHPGGVLRIAPQPFPGPSGTIQFQQGLVIRRVAPIGTRPVRDIFSTVLSHDSVSAHFADHGKIRLAVGHREMSHLPDAAQPLSDRHRYWHRGRGFLPGSTGDFRKIGVILGI